MLCRGTACLGLSLQPPAVVTCAGAVNAVYSDKVRLIQREFLLPLNLVELTQGFRGAYLPPEEAGVLAPLSIG